ncbi:MAG: metallophosphoesterase [Kiritimatiellae bacterium]|nr:metallophosphoesterase [Kiritimatiellia bacterium]
MKNGFCRRDFVKGFTALSGLIAVSKLPALADDPTVFPKRGKWERLVLAYNHIDAGATKPFSILHISDTHFTEAYPHEDPRSLELKKIRTQTFGGHQEEALRDSISWAKENVDFLLHTGDLIDWQSEANFDLVKKYFGSELFGAVGNHEYSRYMWLEEAIYNEEYKNGTRAKVASAYPFDISVASKVVNGVNFVTMDDVFGYVTESQVERFRAEVKKGLPIILCMHVPFYTPKIWRANSKFWNGVNKRLSSLNAKPWEKSGHTQLTDPTTKNFIAYLKTEKLLKGILAGHTHITVQDRFSPTAMEYVVGGNFLFHGQEITIS